MLNIYKQLQKFTLCFMMMIFAYTTTRAQITQPTWWFGVSGAANANWYDGTTQTLNNSLVVPTAFHKAFGIRPYASLLVEYRPTRIWGIMLNVAYDARGAKYKDVIAPCNCLATLHTDINYVSVEPSLRLGFNTTDLYFFAGPRVAYNIKNDFSYTQVNQPNTSGTLSDTKKIQVSGQIGMGYDIMLSKATSVTKVSLSPFVSYQPYFGQEPRSIESMSIQTVRLGMALKFGKGHKTAEQITPPLPMVTAAPAHEFTLAIRAPKTLPRREVSETLPLLNAVFFDESSTSIPSRYVLLSANEAAAFREVQLQQPKSGNMPGRSAAQLNTYHNVLNVVGDRMRSNPSAAIVLNGASAAGPADGRAMASSVKQYLVTVFGIDGSRIAVQGSFKPHPPSEKIGGTKNLDLLGAENRRVDIESTSPQLLGEVGGGMMKPVQIVDSQEDPLDSHVVLTVDSAQQLLKSWYVDVVGANGTTQHYGPYYKDVESIPGRTILGTSPAGDYTVTMTGETKNGTLVKKEGTVHLARQDEKALKGLRYSIIFSFDQATTIASYNKFLTNKVAPLITNGANVVIHGHTDIIGEGVYNQKLSESRAQQTQQVIERALANLGVSNVKFDTSGFGADPAHSPFDNNLPEERFYNRTVIIDIIPVN
ncbi:outer membrane beta-barrel protein [Mucilaginibacter sp. UR6-11]|uniref:outer membrane beta-barrel protein n=1 Tax=Mucilaginibacter sp. UR6-11 TaxID=1435644 RepID=UPI001E455734|nr:outer membrane beta-barrel protein [Mucilaginibacter sp. UR6-11]MCC8426434.1 outer membrane beta-barrel protein [Mucilaginibacter sp. UR6-11]